MAQADLSWIAEVMPVFDEHPVPIGQQRWCWGRVFRSKQPPVFMSSDMLVVRFGVSSPFSELPPVPARVPTISLDFKSLPPQFPLDPGTLCAACFFGREGHTPSVDSRM